MNHLKTIVRILSLFILFVIIGWYGKLSHVREEVIVDEREHVLTNSEADNIILGELKSNCYYFFKVESVTTYNRTLIPFKFKKNKAFQRRQYYSRSKN